MGLVVIALLSKVAPSDRANVAGVLVGREDHSEGAVREAQQRRLVGQELPRDWTLGPSSEGERLLLQAEELNLVPHVLGRLNVAGGLGMVGALGQVLGEGQEVGGH